ncbi:MAG: nickel pincer cofactor biosynthesis protein LarC [bacterium]
MSIAYLDCFAGISGDMFLGALLGLGIDLCTLQNELEKLNLSGYTINLLQVKKISLLGNKFEVKIIDKKHQHRNLADIQNIIGESSLEEKIKKKGLDMFETLGRIEAKVHGVDISKVHFHEVGAIDSIIDILGAIICLDKLNISRLISSPVNVGKGLIYTEHGLLPIPTPATLELLKDIPIYSNDIDTELTTPTGALILNTLINEFAPLPKMQVEKVSYGAGSRDLKQIPNVLRIILGHSLEKVEAEKTISVIETNIDDMNPQFYDYVMEKLLNKGARDVFFTPIYMKKNRPAIKLTVLSLPEDVDDLCNVLFSETTSLGLRVYEVKKKELDREIRKVNTEWGEIRIKIARLNSRIDEVKIAPEYDDCKRIAKERNITISEVYDHLVDIGKTILHVK